MQARFARVLLEGRDPAAGAEAALTTAREAASVPDLAAVTVALRVLARLPG
ncbi:hypothetical protein AB3X21_14810 [Roseomonas mucosa]